MLNGNVQIIADLIFFCYGLNQFLCDSVFVTVHQADPGDSFDTAQLPQKLGQGILAVEVFAIVGNILCDKDQFTASGLCQPLRLIQYALHAAAAVRSSDLRDHAVSTDIIAAFGDFQIGGVGLVRKLSGIPETLCQVAGPVAYEPFRLIPFKGPDQLRQSAVFIDADESIHLRDLFCKLLGVTLDQASRDHQFLSGLLVFRHGEDLIDGFLLCIIDETAGIDYDHIGSFRIIHDGMTRFLKDPLRHICVLEIFGTAQCIKKYSHRLHSFSVFF